MKRFRKLYYRQLSRYKKKGKKMNKKIQIPIGEEDIRMFQELVHYGRDSFTWTFEGVDVEFVKDEGEM